MRMSQSTMKLKVQIKVKNHKENLSVLKISLKNTSLSSMKNKPKAKQCLKPSVAQMQEQVKDSQI